MLLALTLISLAAAVIFGLVMWRVLQHDRRRSEARVAALSAAIDGPVAAAAPSLTAATPLFDGGKPSAMRGRPLLKVAIGFAAAVAVIVLIAMTGGGADERPVPAAAIQAPSTPLELISMRHVQAGSLLTVTGLVRNPGSSQTPDRLIAVVLAFDRRGDFVASGRAPLEFAVLGPGDESPFQVTIPNVTDVGRYRVSFRTEAGVVRHVDRRASARGDLAVNASR